MKDHLVKTVKKSVTAATMVLVIRKMVSADAALVGRVKIASRNVHLDILDSIVRKIVIAISTIRLLVMPSMAVASVKVRGQVSTLAKMISMETLF